MSELVNTTQSNWRSRLLVTVSSMALVASVYDANISRAAASDDKPTLWFEMGVQSSEVHDSTDSFALPVGGAAPSGGITGPLFDGLHLKRSYTEEGSVSFQPRDTDWVFSAAVTFGRSRGKSKFHQSAPIPTTSLTTFHTTIPTYPFPYHKTFTKPVKENANSFSADTTTAESHTIVDFSAGKDVGLGMFGRDSSSVVGAGVRIASFSSKTNIIQFQGVDDIHNVETSYTIPTIAPFPSGARIVPWYFISGGQAWHNFNGRGQRFEHFGGVGPAIYWNASVPIAGDESRNGKLHFDWGINAAILFGRQTNKESHKSTSADNCYSAGRLYFRQRGVACQNSVLEYLPQSSDAKSSRRVTVPNVGGFAGLSLRFPNAKVSLGYRADFFFNAIRTGLSTSNSETRGFNGPYASVSIGLQ